jgi:hypothetical protein
LEIATPNKIITPRPASTATAPSRKSARALPSFRFKVRGSDLRCDLKINSKRAIQGGGWDIAEQKNIL